MNEIMSSDPTIESAIAEANAHIERINAHVERINVLAETVRTSDSLTDADTEAPAI